MSSTGHNGCFHGNITIIYPHFSKKRRERERDVGGGEGGRSIAALFARCSFFTLSSFLD